MRIFVTGATSLLGRAVIPELLSNEHDVIGLARNVASRSMVTALHATAYSGHGYDVERLTEALEPVHAIVHLATGMPNNDSAVEDDWAHSSKIVVGMLRHLIEASEQTGVRTLIFPSFYGIYADHGEEWVSEDGRLEPDPASQAYLEAEDVLNASTTARRSTAVILRMGQIYSSEAPHTRGLLYALKNGQAGIGSTPDVYWPLIHVSDAARAIRLALELSPAGQTFNICDDEPVQKGMLYNELVQSVGGPHPPERTETGALMPYLGRLDSTALHKSVRMSNRKAREWLGFNPKYPTYREGYTQVIVEWSARQESA